MLYELAATLGQLLSGPVRALPPACGVCLLALFVALLVLVSYRLASPRRWLRQVKDQLFAALFELRLFAASPRLVLAAQGRALYFASCYMLLSLGPLALVAVPLGGLLARGSIGYLKRPLWVGESATVSVTLGGSRLARLAPTSIGLRSKGDGLVVETDVLLLRSRALAVVRVRATQPGVHRLELSLDGQVLDKTVNVVHESALSPCRSAAARADYLWSAEPPLSAASGVLTFAIDYPDRNLKIFGLPYYFALLMLSLGLALALKRRFGVVL